jgi:hypothetical protein
MDQLESLPERNILCRHAVALPIMLNDEWWSQGREIAISDRLLN